MTQPDEHPRPSGRPDDGGAPGQHRPAPAPGRDAAEADAPLSPDAPSALMRSWGGSARLDEKGRLDPLASVGGWRGIVEASLPTFVFMVAFMVTQAVWPSGVAAVGVAVVMGAVRLVQRQSPVQAVAGLAVVVLCVVMALTTGQARDFYVWGFVTNGLYSLGFVVSILVGWPVVGLIFGMVRGEGVDWRHDRARRRAYAVATWIMVAVMLTRLAVQLPLYLAEATTALGVARLVMGLPFYALGLWLAWSVSAPRRTAAG
ncbi:MULTISPECIES: DUF3159 domain-containing protein [unclassified Micrococcus]|uniref:DUF3159 domain-containing protein n=1 Tax=unclassified Micrococcus TaxID=2620948 RepID=UPI000AA4EAE4|nr:MULTISPECIES: DUF3159 domain-containing protein [unclassified Micrococcus]